MLTQLSTPVLFNLGRANNLALEVVVSPTTVTVNVRDNVQAC